MNDSIHVPVERMTPVRDFGWAAFLGLLLVYAVFAGVEIAFHWYAGSQDTTTARTFRQWYLDHNSIGKYSHAPGVDLIYPAMILGVAGGSVTSHRSLRAVCFCVALLSLGIFALFPIYIKFFVGADSYLGGLAGLSAIEWVVHLFYPPYVFTFFICGIFTVLGRVLTQRIQGRLDPRLSG